MTRLGYQIPNFTYPGTAPAGLFPTVVRQAQEAEASGFDTVLVMDHFYQLTHARDHPENEMLECYTLLSALAQHTATGPAVRPGHRQHLPEPGPAGEGSSPRSTTSPPVGPSSASAPAGSSSSTTASASSSGPSPTVSSGSRSHSRSLRACWPASRPTFRGRWYTRGRRHQLASTAVEDPADDRRRRREEDAALGGASTPTSPNSSAPRTRCRASSRPWPSTARRSGATAAELTVTLQTNVCVAPTHEQAEADADAFLTARGIDL